jgi:hypothetical protein
MVEYGVKIEVLLGKYEGTSRELTTLGTEKKQRIPTLKPQKKRTEPHEPSHWVQKKFASIFSLD